MLPLTFENPSDYDKVGPMDKVSLKGLTVRGSAHLAHLACKRTLCNRLN
jgi:hypothetical protein